MKSEKTEHNLNILKVKLEEDETLKKFENLDQRLLQPPFLLTIIGSVKAGKSSLILNLLFNKNFNFKKRFDKIFYFSPTCMIDRALKFVREDEDIEKVCDNLDKFDSILEELVKMKTEDEEERDKQYLCLIDDMMGFIKKKSYINFLATRYRHFKISIIITTQSYKLITNVIRENSSGFIIFKIPNNKERNKIYEEYEGVIPNIKQLHNEATKDPYNFLFINFRDLKVYKNFIEELEIKNN